MKVIVFGNYIFANKLVNILLDQGYEVVCLCNSVANDNKYGIGIRELSKIRNFQIYIGNKSEHLVQLENVDPDFAISAAYKYLIPVENLEFPVYGIHFGGLFGPNSIRGRSSSIWYRLRQLEKASIVLYRMTESKFDIGKRINSIQFNLDLIENDAFHQVNNYEKLLQPLLNTTSININPDENNNILASYFPKPNINTYSSKYFSASEIGFFMNNHFSQKELNIDFCTKKHIFGNQNECFMYNVSNVDNKFPDIIYLHGFGSKFSHELQNNKLVKLSNLLEANIVAPIIRGINRIYCNGHQNKDEVIDQFHKIFSFAEKNRSIVVCTSISCLIASDILRYYTKIKHVIFVTPIIDLRLNSFDPAISKYLHSNNKRRGYINLTSTYHSGSKISADLLDYFAQISFLKNFLKFKFPLDVILARDDGFIDADFWREKLVEVGCDINSINIVDGQHSYRSPLQIYYLACQLMKAVLST